MITVVRDQQQHRDIPPSSQFLTIFGRQHCCYLQVEISELFKWPRSSQSRWLIFVTFQIIVTNIFLYWHRKTLYWHRFLQSDAMTFSETFFTSLVWRLLYFISIIDLITTNISCELFTFWDRCTKSIEEFFWRCFQSENYVEKEDETQNWKHKEK